MMRASQALALRHFVVTLLFWAVLAALLIAVAVLSGVVVVSWGFTAWFGENDPQWQKWLIALIALWLLLLNGANFFLTPFVAIIAFGDETCDFTGPFGPELLLVAAFGAGFLTSAAAVVAVILAPPLAEMLRGWLWLLNTANVLLSASLAVVAMVSPLSGQTRRSACALGFIHFAVVIYAAAMAALLLPWTATSPLPGITDNPGEIEMLMAWIAQAAGLLVLVFLNWRKINAVFALSGVSAAVVAFVGAWAAMPPFHAVDLHFGNWYAIPMSSVPISAVPLLLFLRIIWCRCRPHLGRNA